SRMPCRNRLGELPRACSLTDYPSRLSKTGSLASRRSLAENQRGTPGPIFRGRGTRASHARGGADGDRTHDLRLAKPALSQLSYSPDDPQAPRRTLPPSEVGPGRVELPTLPLSGVRSSRLSYGPGRASGRRPRCFRSLKTK